MKLSRHNYSKAGDGYASIKSQVIETESVSVMTLFKLLIMTDYALSPRNYNSPLNAVAKVVSVGVVQLHMHIRPRVWASLSNASLV